MNIENVKRISNIYNKKKLIEIFTDLTENEITEIYKEELNKYWDPYRPMDGYEEWTRLKAWHSTKNILSKKSKLNIDNICNNDDESHIKFIGICAWGKR